MFKFTFSAPIFKILPDSTNKILAVEIRNAELKEVSFAVIDLEKKTLLLEETGFEEAWRVGLSAIENHVLLLHLYTNTNLPDQKGIYAIDFDKKEVAWEQKLWNFEKIYPIKNSKTIISALKFENGNKEIAYFDLQNGEIINPNSVNLILKTLQSLPNFNFTPYYYSSENEYFNTILNFIKPYFNKAINSENKTEDEILGFDYLETDKNFVVLAYYKNMTTINAIFFVFDSLGTKIIENQLTENYAIKELGNRIFVFGNYLCVLQNNTSLNILALL